MMGAPVAMIYMLALAEVADAVLILLGGFGPEGKGMEFQVLILAISLYFAFMGNTANAAADTVDLAGRG